MAPSSSFMRESIISSPDFLSSPAASACCPDVIDGATGEVVTAGAATGGCGSDVVGGGTLLSTSFPF